VFFKKICYNVLIRKKTPMKNPVVTLKMQNDREIVIELYPDVAPNTVNNFISLVKSGFYNGLKFHRVIRGFMIQGGCPRGDGSGGPGYCIKGEFSKNGFKNPLAHTRGVISMARTTFPDSAGSQFFIMHADISHLDGSYAAFGKVTSGLDVVDEIAEDLTNSHDRPYEDKIIREITVETFGQEYPAPIKVQ
jgi:peptidyl-prolyl cis-trans isomerase B (cyclophilin B)